MKKLFKFIAIPMMLCLLVGGWLAYKYVNYIFIQKVNNDGYLYIPTDASFEDVKTQLEPFVVDLEGVQWVAQRKKYSDAVKGGKYKIEKGWNNNQLINHLRSGRQEEIKLQFNYAETIYQMAGKVSKQIEADSVSIIKAVLDENFLEKNQLTAENVQQIFLPNTYHFYWNTQADQFVARMKKEYDLFWNEKRRAEATSLHMTPFEITTLASIVQRETAESTERPKVAGLYLNRLRDQWKLQADPTVIYAVKNRVGFDTIINRVTYDHLKEESPYNTYLNQGLPPAPICIVEPSAIDAVLNADTHDYMYMCASVDNYGFHEFAKTLAEHERNRKKYTAWLTEYLKIKK